MGTAVPFAHVNLRLLVVCPVTLQEELGNFTSTVHSSEAEKVCLSSLSL